MVKCTISYNLYFSFQNRPIFSILTKFSCSSSQTRTFKVLRIEFLKCFAFLQLGLRYSTDGTKIRYLLSDRTRWFHRACRDMSWLFFISDSPRQCYIVVKALEVRTCEWLSFRLFTSKLSWSWSWPLCSMVYQWRVVGIKLKGRNATLTEQNQLLIKFPF